MNEVGYMESPSIYKVTFYDFNHCNAFLFDVPSLKKKNAYIPYLLYQINGRDYHSKIELSRLDTKETEKLISSIEDINLVTPIEKKEFFSLVNRFLTQQEEICQNKDSNIYFYEQSNDDAICHLTKYYNYIDDHLNQYILKKD